MDVEVVRMRALVVVESSFGNTMSVAKAVTEGLEPSVMVDIRDVTVAPTLIDPPVDLLIVGGPTHTFGMSRPDTRRDAARQAGRAGEPGQGVREWLDAVPPGVGRAAAFDTRINKRWVPGSAARGIAKRLRALGGTLVVDPESFYVTGTPGPLAGGELARARQWGERLATMLIGLDDSRR